MGKTRIPSVEAPEAPEAREIAAAFRKLLAYRWQHSAGEIGLDCSKGWDLVLLNVFVFNATAALRIAKWQIRALAGFLLLPKTD